MWGDQTVETVHADAHAGLAQGDIILLEEGLASVPGTPFGVIITADCDLENKKNDGIVSYLPIYPLDQYLDRFWAAKHVQSLADTALKTVSTHCQLSRRETQDLREWLEVDQLDNVLPSVAKIAPAKRSSLESVHRSLSIAHICLSNRAPLEKLRGVATCEQDPSAYLLKQLRAGRSSIGDSGFFISEIVGHNQLGFVVRFARVLGLPERLCFRSETERLTSGLEEAAWRVARLNPILKYRVAQLFAAQYSRIGLPNILRDLEQVAIDELAEKLLGDEQ